jgi:GDP-L-fucose synthase
MKKEGSALNQSSKI